MRQAAKKLFRWILLLAAWSALAQFDDTELELVPLPTELQLSGMAKVVTHIARPEDCIAAIMVNRIDGARMEVSTREFVIEPGFHTINGKAIMDTTHCPLAGPRLQVPSTPDLEVNFEIGSTYYIGYFHKPENTEEWQLVVWNIETNPPGLETNPLLGESQ